MSEEETVISSKLYQTLVLTSLLLFNHQTYAADIKACPNEAFAISAQGELIAIELVSGKTTVLKEPSEHTRSIDALAIHQGKLIGFDSSRHALTLFDVNLKPTYITIEDFEMQTGIIAGEQVSGRYFLYASSLGLVELTIPQQITQAVSYTTINHSSEFTFRDMAFNPHDQHLYAIDDRSNYLYQIDVNTGHIQFLATLSSEHSLQANYFDEYGYLYASESDNSTIYKININSETANLDIERFADSNHDAPIRDGARCAEAPLHPAIANTDFGDAPNSYQTRLDSNGPRHEFDGHTYLGSTQPDSEHDAITGVLRDEHHQLNDEDGLRFVTSIEPGKDAIVQVEASTAGILTAWFDWNQDGDFKDDNEHVIQDLSLQAGTQAVTFSVHDSALTGQTWSRFRFSQQEELNYSGGAYSGEVEDHQVSVTTSEQTVRYFPSPNGFLTLAYEDYWPYTADFDMNDVVMYYRITEFYQQDRLTKTYIEGRLAALGADYRNGFAVRLQGLDKHDIDDSNSFLIYNDEVQPSNGLELDSQEAIFIIADDLKTIANTQCPYFRTDNACQENEVFSFKLIINLNADADISSLSGIPYDPFIFATPGYYHGEALPLHPGRTWEVHLPDQSPTEKFNAAAMFGLGDDDSQSAQGKFFKSDNNLPWAMLITDEWKWPAERKDPVMAYPAFVEYAQSGGLLKKDWYKSPQSEAIYQR
ncbi:LruC domain-containing protein [Vibrio agarivorans]|uniref:LruC domain-containing protein n=1 Tax=Vibrio agarivorans TaxID=153622 RepID=UPI00222F9601|nr:LruC domain-containing protein [Vibrio agarivorans]